MLGLTYHEGINKNSPLGKAGWKKKPKPKDRKMDSHNILTELSTLELQEKLENVLHAEDQLEYEDRSLYLLKTLIKEELMLRAWAKVVV